MGQARSTQRWVSRRAENDRELLERMRELAAENPAYGYRFIWALLRGEGVPVNLKRVHRLWKVGGLKVVRAKRDRERTGASENACSITRAEYPNHVWTYDFVFDETSDGRKLKFLTVIDEFTRLCLRIEVGRSMTAKTVVRVLAELVQVHGEPGAIRSDNGSEFTAAAVRDWLASAGIKTLYIERGSPWENGYAESFNSRFRAEFLDRESFRTLPEAQVMTDTIYKMFVPRRLRAYTVAIPQDRLDPGAEAAYEGDCARHAGGTASSGTSDSGCGRAGSRADGGVRQGGL